jgi:hypothetical protein
MLAASSAVAAAKPAVDDAKRIKRPRPSFLVFIITYR